MIGKRVNHSLDAVALTLYLFISTDFNCTEHQPMDMTQSSQITRVPTVQVIDGDGSFQSSGVAAFLAEHKFSACKTKYQVVAIMGPQSSGKSTLLNHVVGSC